MKSVYRFTAVLSVLLVFMALTGCSREEPKNEEMYTGASIQGTAGSAEVEEGESRPKQTAEPCMAIIEWVDFLMINDIKYYRNEEADNGAAADQLGERVGEVAFKLNEQACTEHVIKNGDAAFLEEGTPIYALQGYKPEFRVGAGNKIYEVHENPNAETLGDLLDISGKLAKVSLESGMDGSLIGDFSKEASAEFIEELLPLRVVGREAVYKKAMFETGIFLRVTLNDGTSSRMVYYPKANAFGEGAYGTEVLQKLIVSERVRIKAAAGM